jgi:hypothetical protein
MIGNGSQYSIQRTDPQRLMRGNGDTVRRWFLRLQDNVTAYLMKLDVFPVTA